MSAQRVSVQRGGCVCPGDVCPTACWYTHPLVDRMTEACENITFPETTLRAVIISTYLPVDWNLQVKPKLND